jgi:hypothetical protein
LAHFFDFFFCDEIRSGLQRQANDFIFCRFVNFLFLFESLIAASGLTIGIAGLKNFANKPGLV